MLRLRSRLLLADHCVDVLQEPPRGFLAYRLEAVRKDGVVALLQEVPQHRVILEAIDPVVFTEASDFISDLEKFVHEIMDHSSGYGTTFDLIDQLHSMVDDHADLHSDTANMVLLALERLKEGWREQAEKYRTQQGKASEE